MARPKPADLPGWPRLLSKDMAAAYISLSVGTLGNLPIVVRRVGSRVLYDRHDLDRWADGLAAVGTPANANDADDDWISRLGT